MPESFHFAQIILVLHAYMYMLMHGRAPVEKSRLISLHGSRTLTIFGREKVDDGVKWRAGRSVLAYTESVSTGALATVGNGLTRSILGVRGHQTSERAGFPA